MDDLGRIRDERVNFTLSSQAAVITRLDGNISKSIALSCATYFGLSVIKSENGHLSQ